MFSFSHDFMVSKRMVGLGCLDGCSIGLSLKQPTGLLGLLAKEPAAVIIERRRDDKHLAYVGAKLRRLVDVLPLAIGDRFLVQTVIDSGDLHHQPDLHLWCRFDLLCVIS